MYVSSVSTVTLDRCKFTNNTQYSYSDVEGACIYSEGTLTAQNCLFYDNTASSYSDNGIVALDDGSSTIINCTFADNTNGTIWVKAGTHNITMYI